MLTRAAIACCQVILDMADDFPKTGVCRVDREDGDAFGITSFPSLYVVMSDARLQVLAV